MTTEDAPQTPPSPVEIKVPPGKWRVRVLIGDSVQGDPIDEFYVDGPASVFVSTEQRT